MSLGSTLVVLKLEALCAHTLKRGWLPEPDGDSEQSTLARRDAQLIGSLTTCYLAVCLRGRETEQHGRVRLTEVRMRPAHGGFVYWRARRNFILRLSYQYTSATEPCTSTLAHGEALQVGACKRNPSNQYASEDALTGRHICRGDRPSVSI